MCALLSYTLLQTSEHVSKLQFPLFLQVNIYYWLLGLEDYWGLNRKCPLMLMFSTLVPPVVGTILEVYRNFRNWNLPGRSSSLGACTWRLYLSLGSYLSHGSLDCSDINNLLHMYLLPWGELLIYSFTNVMSEYRSQNKSFSLLSNFGHAFCHSNRK